MTIDTTATLFAQRRALLRSALEQLITAEVIPAQVLTYIDQLYARHRAFEAERIAGLALWLGKDRSTAWREICFEGFGTVLRAATTVVHGLAAMDAQRTWEEHTHSHQEFVMTCGLSRPVYTRWCQLGHQLVTVADERLSDRGRRVGQLLHWLCGTAPLPEHPALHTHSTTDATTSLVVIESAAADAAHALLTVSRCLWHVWVQRAWAPHIPTCEILLKQELGIGTVLGQALIALGQDVAMWDIDLPALARLEVVATVLTQSTTATRNRPHTTAQEDRT